MIFTNQKKKIQQKQSSHVSGISANMIKKMENNLSDCGFQYMKRYTWCAFGILLQGRSNCQFFTFWNPNYDLLSKFGFLIANGSIVIRMFI